MPSRWGNARKQTLQAHASQRGAGVAPLVPASSCRGSLVETKSSSGGSSSIRHGLPDAFLRGHWQTGEREREERRQARKRIFPHGVPPSLPGSPPARERPWSKAGAKGRGKGKGGLAFTGSLHAKALGLLAGHSGGLPEEIVPSALLEGAQPHLSLEGTR